MTKERDINLKRVRNARELGGYLTEDGRSQVRWKRLLRTGQLTYAMRGAGEEPAGPTEDYRVLSEDYDLAVIVDLRSCNEISAQIGFIHDGRQITYASAADPEFPGCSLRNCPAVDPLWAHQNWQPLDPRSPSPREKLDFTREFYRELARSSQAQKSFYCFFRALLSAPDERAVLWHCVNGRDRTGIGAVLLLAALDVAMADIRSDYLRANDFPGGADANDFLYKEDAGLKPVEFVYLDAYIETVAEMLRQDKAARGVAGRFSADGGKAPRDMAETWNRNAKRNLQEYLLRFIGITDEEIEELRRKYLEPAGRR
ncbi:tyrosine-protein phosphatase [Aminicella lysinilytica]|uniref:Protein tyrosine/serine phosphatase n=1 Tax=Aminicella lysinilytica TaxID=433323 RepID=A0A4R6PX90_9FIRM|nr:tyrosine-protein phosphatase [Aminicella lysinilytica]TDP50342.1 protein tyrosine/serine phosphatase [Aminicella lysinilytica]